MSAPATGTSAGAALVPARAMPLPGVDGRAPRSDLATIGAPRPGNGDGLAQRAAPPVVPRPLPSTRRIRPSSHRGEDDSESGGSLSPAASRKVPRQSWASTTGAPVPEASEARRLSEPEPPAQPPSFISTDLSSVMNAVLFRPSSRPDNTPLPKVTTLPRPDDKFYRLPSDGGDNKLASVPRLSAQEWKDSTSQLWKALPAATPAPLPTIGAVLSRLDSYAVTILPTGLPGPYAPLPADPSTSAGPYPGVGPIPPFSNGGPPPGAPSAGPVRRKPRNSAGNKPYEYAPRAPGKYSTREALPSRPEDKPYNYNPQPVRAMAPGRTPGYTPQLLVPYVVPLPVFPQPAWALNYKAKNRPVPPPDVALAIYNPFDKPPESLPAPVAPDEPVASSSSSQPPRAPPLAPDLLPTPAPPRRASNGGAKRPVPVPAPLAAPESSSRHDRRSESAQIEAISQPNTPAIIERPRRVTVRPKRVGEDDAEPEVEVEDEEDNYSSAAESDKGDPDEDGEELDDASSSGDKASSDGTRPRRKVSPTKKSLELMNAMSDESEGEALAQGIQHRAQKTLKLSHAAGAPAVMEYMPMDVTATGQGFPSDDEGGDKPKKKKRKPLPDGGLPMDTRPIKFVSDEERMIVMDEMAAPYKAARNSTTRERTRSAFVQSWCVPSLPTLVSDPIQAPLRVRALPWRQRVSSGDVQELPQGRQPHRDGEPDQVRSRAFVGIALIQSSSASFGKAMRQAFPKIEVRRLGHRGNSTYHCTSLVLLVPLLTGYRHGNPSGQHGRGEPHRADQPRGCARDGDDDRQRTPPLRATPLRHALARPRPDQLDCPVAGQGQGRRGQVPKGHRDAGQEGRGGPDPSVR